MIDTEQAILEAVQEYYLFYQGMTAGAVEEADVEHKLAALHEACAEHANNNDGRFPISSPDRESSNG